MGLEAGRERPDGAWFAAGVLLTAGGLAPSLATCFHAEQVLTMDPLQRLGLFLATDGLFAVTSYGFLLLGETFGRERLEGRAAETYPGPWKEPSGARIMPKYFRPYLLVLPAFVGLLIPAATTAGSLLWTEHGILAATCLTTYLATLLSQIWMETAFIKRGSFMWPMVPVVHMIYRLWQLGRGSVLVAALHGPVFLQYLQACLAVIWVLNFGAVMAWMPWLYRWHLQPKAARE
ncbi:hypothetical protein WJX75_009588 [Coccomyxa subellipsoidea]|uniref:Uncharacterized protein n=1 Tax=Coccomyxa subellipsoidea TaxID=248742 RepID=A0ABR2Z5B4_9CHLO